MTQLIRSPLNPGRFSLFTFESATRRPQRIMTLELKTEGLLSCRRTTTGVLFAGRLTHNQRRLSLRRGGGLGGGAQVTRYSAGQQKKAEGNRCDSLCTLSFLHVPFLVVCCRCPDYLQLRCQSEATDIIEKEPGTPVTVRERNTHQDAEKRDDGYPGVTGCGGRGASASRRSRKSLPPT